MNDTNTINQGTNNLVLDGDLASFPTGQLLLQNDGYSATLEALALTANQVLTLPNVTDTLVTLAAIQTLTNKTLTTPVIASITSGSGTFVVNTGGTVTIPNATDTVALLAATQTFTNKTLTTPVIASITSGSGTFIINTSGTITVPNVTDTLVTLAATQTLTNKTLTTPVIASITSGSGSLTINTSGVMTVPNATDTLVGRNTTDTLTNKTLGSTNNLTGSEISSFTPDGYHTLIVPIVTTSVSGASGAGSQAGAADFASATPYLAQAFTQVTSGIVTSVTLIGSGYPGTQGGYFLGCQIQTTTGNIATNGAIPSGTVLGTSATVNPATFVVYPSEASITFTFASGPTLTAGTNYALVVYVASGTLGFGQVYFNGLAVGGSNTEGFSYSATGTSWANSGNWSLNYNVQVNTISDTLVTLAGTQTLTNKTFSATSGSGVLPLGAVVASFPNLTGAYSTTATTAADGYGWVLCNGQTIADTTSPMNGVAIPNINNSVFLQGNTTAGATGGSANVTLTTNNLPSHTHGAGSYATTLGISDGITISGGTASLTGTTSFAGTSHTHDTPVGIVNPGGQVYLQNINGIGNAQSGVPTASTGLSLGGSINTYALLTDVPFSGNGTVGISSTAASRSGSVTLTGSNAVTGTSAAAGSSSSFSIVPTYISAVFLMRIK